MTGQAIKVRPAIPADYASAASLYAQFHSGSDSIDEVAGEDQWNVVLNQPGTTVFVAVLDDVIIGSVTLHILQNMTRRGRPYTLIENVITHRDHRGKGVGRLVMEHAIAAAWAADAYKVMLLTGKHRADGGVTEFYEKLGFSADEKHGMQLKGGAPVKPHH